MEMSRPARATRNLAILVPYSVLSAHPLQKPFCHLLGQLLHSLVGPITVHLTIGLEGHQEKLHYFFVLFCTFKVRNFTFSYLFLPFLPLKSRNIKKKYKKVKKSDDTFPDGSK